MSTFKKNATFTAVAALNAIIGLWSVGCGPVPTPVSDEWVVSASNDIPEEYLNSVLNEAGIVAGYCQEAHWGGIVTIVDTPFYCPGSSSATNWCSGSTYDPQDITIVYDPSVGLGPAISTTAASWELCNARIRGCFNIVDESKTPDCVSWVTAHGG